MVDQIASTSVCEVEECANGVFEEPHAPGSRESRMVFFASRTMRGDRDWRVPPRNESEQSTGRCAEIADFGLASSVDAEYTSTPHGLFSFSHFVYNPPSGV